MSSWGTSDVELSKFGNNNKLYKPFGRFLGVFPSDKLPIINKPCCLIVNYDDSTEGGSHWVSMAFPVSKDPIYFDSYGKPPEFFEHLLNVDVDFKIYLKNNSNNGEFKYNKFNFQSYNNDACGEYFLIFLKYGPPSNVGIINKTWNAIKLIKPPNRDKYVIKFMNVRT